MYRPEQVNVGAIEAPKAGSILLDFADRQAKMNQLQMDKAIQGQKMMMEKSRFDRENLLNQRQDAEYNREIGLRDTRKDLANEFATNKFANKFGNKDTEAFQQDIVDYVHKGGVVTDDLASRWQNRIEQAVPFQEDAKGALKAELLKRGEDPLKADAYAESMTTGMVSRAGRQAILDANRKDQQDYYKQAAEANRDIAKMGVDVYKEQAGNKTEMDKARMNLFGAGGGSGSGGGIGGTTYNKLDVGDYNLSVLPQWTKVGDEAKLQEVIRGFQAAGVPAGLVNKAIENSIDKNLDNTINYDLLEKNIMNVKNMYGGTGTTSNVDVPNLDRAAFMPQYVPKQVVGYDPNKWREESKALFPEMYPKVAEESKSTGGGTSTGYQAAVKSTEAPNYQAVNKTSGAMGQYQFLNSTLNDYRDKFGGFSNEEFLKNPKLQDEVFKEYTKDNEKFLASKNIEVNDWTRWLSHNLGIGNVKPFLEGRMTDGVKKAIEANLPGKEATIDSYIDKYASRFNASDLVAKVGPENVNPEATKSKSLDYFKAQEKMSPAEKSTLLGFVDSGNTEKANELVKQILDRKITADTVTGSNVAPSAPIPQVDKNGNLVDTSKNIKSGVSILDELKNTFNHATKGSNLKDVGTAGLATANAIAGQTLNVLGSPYTAMKYETDALLGNTHKPTVFQDMEKSSHDTAIKELSKVTEHPEEALLAAELASPFASRRLSAPIEAGIQRLVPKTEAAVSSIADNVRLPNYRPEGSSNWVNPNTAVATDKMNGVGVQDVINRSGAVKGNLTKAEIDAAKARSELDDALKYKNKSEPDYWGKTKYFEDATTKMKDVNEAHAIWNGALNAFEKGQIGAEKLKEIAVGVNGKINTRELMESLDSVVGVKSSVVDDIANTMKQLPYHQGMPKNWVSPYADRVATDKINGIGVDDVISKASNRIDEGLRAQYEAKQMKDLLNTAGKGNGTTLSKPGYFNALSDKMNKISIEKANSALNEFKASGGKLSTKEGRQLQKELDDALRNYNKIKGYYQK